MEPSAQFSKQLIEGVQSFIAGEGYEVPAAEIVPLFQGEMDFIPEKLFAVIVAQGYDPFRVRRSVEKGSEIFNALKGLNESKGGWHEE